MARYRVTFNMPVRLAAGDRAMAIAGRLDEALQGLSARGVTDPELATHRIRRNRLRSVTVTMTVRAPDAARALSQAFDALRSALGRDVRAWDVPGTGVTVVPVTPPPPRDRLWPISEQLARERRGLADPDPEGLVFSAGSPSGCKNWSGGAGAGHGRMSLAWSCRRTLHDSRPRS
jgi:hypothetical protein